MSSKETVCGDGLDYVTRSKWVSQLTNDVYKDQSDDKDAVNWLEQMDMKALVKQN